MIIITGVSRGIGNYLFNKYLQKGEEVYGTYNRNKPAVANDKYISRVDVTDYQQVSRWVENIGNSSENVVLINCAGANYTSFAHNADLKNWIHVVNVNLIGTFNVIQAAKKANVKRKKIFFIFNKIISHIILFNINSFK